MNGMKLFYRYFTLSILLTVLGYTTVSAQTDTLVITPNRGSSDLCGFRMTVKNRNAAGKAIFKIKLEMNAGDGTLFTVAQAPMVPATWVTGIDESSAIDSFQAQQTAIAAGATLSGFKFGYFNNGELEFDTPKQIKWTTYDNSGLPITTGTIAPVCVMFQYFATYDTATVNTHLSGCDPVFQFTVGNRNDLFSPIGHLRFELTSLTSGTIRPSKCSAPPDWLLDSVTTRSVYFHTDNNQIQGGSATGPFTVALRANPNITKHSFAFWASDDQNFLIDRDTVANIAIQANCSDPENDSVSVGTSSGGCVYSMTLRNWHVSNLVQPGLITKLVLKSMTAGVQFDAAPNAPAKWTKTVTGDSIVYAADSTNHGIPGGVISNAFSYSVSGSTSTPFNIAWTTYRPQGMISTGTVTSSCAVEAPRGDSVTVGAGALECAFVAQVINLHNSPASNIGSVSLSIPSGSGQLNGLNSSAGWNFASVSATELKFTPATTSQTPGASQNFNFGLLPAVNGQPIVLTVKTAGDDAAIITTDTTSIACTPAPKPCDDASVNPISVDDCQHQFTVTSHGGADIIAIKFETTQNWTIDSILSLPDGWMGAADSSTTLTLASTTGILSGESRGGFNLKFAGNNTTDTFTVIVTTTDRNNRSCATMLSMQCSSTAGVSGEYSNDPRISNIAIVPNPTRGESNLSFTLPLQERVFVTVYDALGKSIMVPTNQIYGIGTYSLPIDLVKQASGTYYIRIETPFGVVTKKVVKQ